MSTTAQQRIPKTLTPLSNGPRVEEQPGNAEYPIWFQFGSSMGTQGFRSIEQLSKEIVPWIRSRRIGLLKEALALDLAEQEIRDRCADAAKRER